MKRTRITRNFPGVDERGEPVMIRVVQEYEEVPGEGGRPVDVLGARRLEAGGGERLRRVGRGYYETDTGARITSDSPDAE